MTTAISARPAETGFTLMELLVVLAIMALVAALLLPRTSLRPSFVGDTPATESLAMELNTARNEALANGEMTAVQIGEPFEIVGEDTTSINFHADGSSNGGEIAVAGRQVLLVEPFTGTVMRGTD